MTSLYILQYCSKSVICSAMLSKLSFLAPDRLTSDYMVLTQLVDFSLCNQSISDVTASIIKLFGFTSVTFTSLVEMLDVTLRRNCRYST